MRETNGDNLRLDDRFWNPDFRHAKKPRKHYLERTTDMYSGAVIWVRTKRFSLAKWTLKNKRSIKMRWAPEGIYLNVAEICSCGELYFAKGQRHGLSAEQKNPSTNKLYTFGKGAKLFAKIKLEITTLIYWIDDLWMRRFPLRFEAVVNEKFYGTQVFFPVTLSSVDSRHQKS